MVVIGWVIGLVLGIGLGGGIATKMKSKCNHKWKLIDSGNIWRGNKNNIRGWIKVYECEHCLKMKKEQVEVD